MYFRKIFNLTLLLACSFFLFESCTEKESIDLDNEPTEFVSPLWQLFSSEIFRDTDRQFCFKLEFPIEVRLADETTKSLNSYEALISFVEKWYKENAENFKDEPALNYPIKAILKDEILAEFKDDLAFSTKIESCLNNFHLEFHNFLSTRCYQIDYPITITEQDDTKVELHSYEAFYELLSTTESRLEINVEFPVSITIDGRTYVINSDLDLEKAMDVCADFLIANTENHNEIVCAFIDSELLRWIESQGNYQFLDDCFNITYPVTIVSSEKGNSNINNNEEFADAIEEILSRIIYDGDLIDFNYPIGVYVVDEDEQVSLNSGDEFIQLFEHCR